MQLPCAWFEQIVGTLDAPARPAAAGPADACVVEGSAADAPSAQVPSTEVAAKGAAAGGQRRREPRVGLRANVTLIPLTVDAGLGSTPVGVPVRDLSAGGIGFLHVAKVSLDAQFVALLPHGNDSVAVLCQVAYYQPLGEHHFSVGAKFVRVLRQPAGETAGAVLTRPDRQTPTLRRVAS